jgi:cobalamin biosynthesis protein CobT
MPKVEVFAQCRMKNFASLVARELGVRVRFKGREICVHYGPPPVIHLPNMEYAREEDVLPIYGFCLHEAGHLCYTDPKIGAQAPNYLVKIMHNAIEDEYMERMLEKDFPGARDMLINSYVEGIRRVLGGRPPVDGKSLLLPENRDLVVAQMNAASMDTSDRLLVEEVAKRLEILRAAKLWILEQRRYPLPLLDWPVHPWREVFQQETTPRAKNTRQAYDQAVRIIERLGVKPCLPSDKRPIDVAKSKIAEAKARLAEARTARKALVEAKRARNAEISRKCERTLEHYRLLEARDSARKATEELNETNAALDAIRERMSAVTESQELSRQRLAASREKLEQLQQEAADGTGGAMDELQRRIGELEESIAAREASLDRREAMIQELRKRELKAASKSEAAQAANADANNAESQAQREYEKEAKRIRKEVAEAHRPVIEMAVENAKQTRAGAKNATDAANEVLAAIKERDAKMAEPLEPGALAKLVEQIFQEFREQSTEEELDELLGNAAGVPGSKGSKPVSELKWVAAAALNGPARKYSPYDRSHDRVERVAETPEGRAEYERARREYAKIIQETTQRLKRLHSPVKNRLRANAEQGRLDPRKAYKIGLGLRGVAVDLAKVWRTTDVSKEPKAAVSLLIDCSGSMKSAGTGGEPPIILARKAAAALSEVLRGLSIPHEIVGHTTFSDDVDALIKNGEINPEDIDDFSRFVPFRGYVFKGFEESAAPASAFSNVEMQDNLDGEALLWAVQRLAARRERTKICISISDGMPHATMSNCAELERHLLTTCKQIEAREDEGLFLFGLGIGEERVRQFYRKAAVLHKVEELPAVVLGIVERTLIKSEGMPL